MESAEYAFPKTGFGPAPLPDPFHLLRFAAEISIPRLGPPLLLTPFFAELATAGPGAESLVKPGSWIRFKPFFAAETFLETMLVLHHPYSLASSLP